MAKDLSGMRIAALVANGFEKVELTKPMKALEDAGATVDVVSLEEGTVRAWAHDHWEGEVDVDRTVGEASPSDYDGLLLPGGQMNPDNLRMNEEAVAFVKGFFEEEKPVAAICHGPWMLVEADVVRGREVTSWPSIRTDLKNAGAHVVDEQVVVDGGLVTSRKPDDIPAFNREMIEAFREGRSAAREAARSAAD